MLHHLNDTAEAIARCSRKLKPGAPLLLYLYYNFENRPWAYRAIWRLSDAVDLFRALNDGELASRADTDYVLGLMSTVIESDSWGLKEEYPGSRVAFKAGWGPRDSQYDLEQVGIVGGGSSGYVMAIMFHTNGRSRIATPSQRAAP